MRHFPGMFACVAACDPSVPELLELSRIPCGSWAPALSAFACDDMARQLLKLAEQGEANPPWAGRLVQLVSIGEAKRSKSMKIVGILKARMVRAALAVGVTVAPVLAHPGSAVAADLKEVNFSEAVHNLGYINLYVGLHAGIFEKNGLKMNVSAAGGDTQTFAAVLGGSADFAIGDATMAVMSREAGGPGVVVGTVVQRAHYFGVSKTLEPITDPKQFKGLTIVTSPEPNTNYSVAKRMLENAGLKIGTDTTILQVSPGTEIAAMLAGQADMAIAYQPGVASAVDQGAKVVFDFSNYVGPFCNTGIMVLPSTIETDPEMVQALVTSFEEASRKTYADPDFAKQVARAEFPDLPGEVVDAAIDAELEYKIPAETVVVQKDQWKNLMDMQVYLGNVKGTVPFDDVIDNSFADKAVEKVGG